MADNNRKSWLLEWIGLASIIICFGTFLLQNYTMRIGHADVAAWYLFGKNFAAEFAKQRLGFGFPLVIFLSSKVIGSIPAFLINIPILMILLGVFYKFSKKCYCQNNDTNIDLGSLCGAIALLILILLNKNYFLELTNPLRDPLSWLLILISVLCIMRFREHAEHPYRWLVMCGICIAYASATRETSALIVIPLLVYAVHERINDRNLPFFKPALFFIAVCAFAAVPYLIQNHLTTGSAFLPGQFVTIGKLSPFSCAKFQESYQDILLFFFHRYNYLLLFLVPGVVSAIKRKSTPVLLLSITAILSYYFFYAFVLNKAVWRYLLIIDFFLIPMISMGIIATLNILLTLTNIRTSIRIILLRIVTLLVLASTALISVLPNNSGAKYTIKDALNFNKTISQYVPMKSVILAEGQTLSKTIKCFTALDSTDIEPETLNELMKYRFSDTNSGFVVYYSKAMERCFETEFDLTPIYNMALSEYHLGPLLGNVQLIIAKIKPWSTNSSTTQLNTAEPGKYVLQVDAGRLSKTERKFAKLSFNGKVLTKHLTDYINYFVVDVAASNATHCIQITSDNAISKQFWAQIQSIDDPVVMNMDPKNVVHYSGMISPTPLRTTPHRVLIAAKGTIKIPTLEPSSNYGYLLDIACHVAGKNNHPHPTLQIKHNSTMLFDEVISPHHQNIHCAIAIESSWAWFTPNDADLSFHFTPATNNQYLVIDSITVTRAPYADKIATVFDKGVINNHISGLYYPTEFNRQSPQNSWAWTGGRVRTPLLLKKNLAPWTLTIGYFDENRPTWLPSLTPIFCINGQLQNAEFSDCTRNGMKYIEAQISIPRKMLPNNVCILEFTCPTWNPYEENVSTDERQLGLMLHSISATHK